MGTLMVLTREEIEKILAQALRILSEIGMKVEHKGICDRLAEEGAELRGERLVFPKVFLQHFLESRKPADVPAGDRLSCYAEIYQGWYCDPRDSSQKPWTEKRLVETLRLVRALPGVDDLSMLGCPLEETPVQLQPLFERYYAAKYGFRAGGSVWDSGLCQAIYEMNAVIAAEKGLSERENFSGGVFLISPLVFGKVEAEQFWYFAKRGLRPFVGNLASLGGSAPVTLAGALSLQLAESIFINLLEHCFFGETALHIDGSMAVLDMMSGSFCYGRPEQVTVNLAMAQIAAYLGACSSGHSGYCDAELPGALACGQKLQSALLTLGAGAKAHVAAGLLRVDELFSPLQMLWDSEMVCSIRKATEKITVDEENLALEYIAEAGPGGNFLMSEHSAAHCRELWRPQLEEKNRRIKDLLERAENQTMPESLLSPEAERELYHIIYQQKKS